MQRYIGIIDGGGDVWGVTIPDLPGCVGSGTTLDEAIDSATIALQKVAGYKVSGGFSVPPPSSLEQALAKDDFGPNPITVLIPLLIDAGRTVRANLTLDAGLLEAIDKAAKLRGVTRSAFVADAARTKLQIA
jgi:predicted RNase H-like HicB family nuclease